MSSVSAQVHEIAVFESARALDAERSQEAGHPAGTTRPKEVVQFAEKTREAVGVLQGQRGNTLDRAVTFRDVEGDAFLKDLREGSGAYGVPTEPDTDFTVPPIPTGFQVERASSTQSSPGMSPPTRITLTEIYGPIRTTSPQPPSTATHSESRLCSSWTWIRPKYFWIRLSQLPG